MAKAATEIRLTSNVLTRAVRRAIVDGPQLVVMDETDRNMLLLAIEYLDGDKPLPESMRRVVSDKLEALRARPGVPGVLALLPEQAARGEE